VALGHGRRRLLRQRRIALRHLVHLHHGASIAGSPNLGGAIVTAGGLVFVGATLDRRFRAYDAASGAELWSAELPAGGKATPMSYLGGDGGSFGRADALVGFALPGAPGDEEPPRDGN